MILKTFEPNTKGRDFVIGDLHGSMPCFENLLVNLNFNPLADRMFSVGDLVDRGPQSMDCLRLIKEDWFHAVKANHELMMFEAFTGGYTGQFWFQNGGAWGFNAACLAIALQKRASHDPEYPLPERVTEADYELIDMLNLVEALPYMITVNMSDGKKFHIIHAELPPGIQGITDEVLADPAQVESLAKITVRDGDAFLWSRFLYDPFYRADLSNHDKIVRSVAYRFKGGLGPFNDNLSHIISGHTPVQRPLTLIGQTNIDTCAFAACRTDAPKWAALTCVELGSWSFYQATETEFRTIEPLVVDQATIRAVQVNNTTIGGVPVPTVDVINGLSA